MRILVQVSPMSGELETNILFAVIAMDDAETVKCIENRRILFNSVSEALVNIEGSSDLLFQQYKDFSGVGFFYDDLGITTSQQKELDKRGYIEVEEGFGDDYDVAETEMEMLCVGENGFWVIATDGEGVDIRTSEISYAS